jgi:2',3'-cyclic-nucleotide 2'-phosphodiesterase (5'-nucleotidase family)
MFLILVICAQMLGCSQASKKPFSEKDIPSSAYQSADPNQVTIAFVGMNDFHGSLLPRERKLTTSKKEMMVKSGGAPALASMISILRDEMKGRVLIIDAGDEWQGTLESNLVKGASVVNFFNRIGVQVAAIGNHEFDFNIENMRARFKEAKYPYVAANIFEKKNGKHPKWDNVYPSKILEVAGIKVGVIGHSTVYTPGTTRYEFVSHLDFKDPIQIVNSEAEKLRAKGAQAVFVTAHAGTFCDRKNLNDWKLHSANEVQGKCEDDEISKLAAGVKPHLLDGIVSGHTHQVIHHWLSGIPTIQDEAYNQHFNIIYLTFDRRTGKVISDLTKIEGLIPICTEHFEGLSHCDVRRLPSGSAPSMVPAMFHGKKVVDDPEVSEWLKPIIASTAKYRTEVIATSVLPLEHFRDREGAFGNLVADALRDKAHTDFSLVNSGGIRTSLDAGPITFDGIFRALPFDNLLNVVRLKGKDVKLMYRVATAGSHGIVGFSGLKIKLVPYDREVPKHDLNGDGKSESWEGNRIVDIKTTDGKDLQDDRYYSIATYDFLVNGGDDLIWFMKRVPEKNISRKYSDYCRDIVTDYLKKKPVFNTPENPLVDPKNPRVIF